MDESMTAGVVAHVQCSRKPVLSQSRGTGDHPGQWILDIWRHRRVRSSPVRPFSFLLPDCTTPAPFPAGSIFTPQTRWGSRTEGHLTVVLGNIRKHIKVLKMVSIGDFPRWEDVRGLETQIVALPTPK